MARNGNPKPERVAAHLVGSRRKAARRLIASPKVIAWSRVASAARSARSASSPAAGVWLAAHSEDSESNIRFDAILVAPGKIPRHIPAAFEAE
jgi:putative endonuclease